MRGPRDSAVGQTTAAALDHPFISKIYETGEEEDRFFISIEYVQGTTLRDKLAEGPLPLKDGLQKATEIAEALEAAHRQTTVHRDLKPSNIMLTPEGRVKVMDFMDWPSSLCPRKASRVKSRPSPRV